MEILLTCIIFIFILYYSFKDGAICLALLLNVVVFRAIPYVNYKAPYYGYYNENDLVLGAILPILCFVVILSKIFLRKRKVKYCLDVFDVFMTILTIVMLLSLLVTPQFKKSILYTGIFILLGLPFYFVTKIYFLNMEKYSQKMYNFLNTIVIASILFSGISIYLHEVARYPYQRMTFPGVFPIPFCLFLTSSLIIFIVYYFKPSFKKNLGRKIKFWYSIPFFCVLILAIIKTNTRGPVFALLLASVLVLTMFFKVKVHIKFILGFLASLFFGFIALISFFDINKIAVRFIDLAPKNAESFSPRLHIYLDAILIFINRPLGISVGTFGEFYTGYEKVDRDTGSYAHNLFMELISSFGIFGLLISLFLVYIFLNEYNFMIKNQEKVFSNPLFLISIFFMFFFFFETQFSFTLNTHKGFYLSLALYSVLKYKFLKEIKNED